MALSLCSLSLIVYIIGSGQVNDLMGGNRRSHLHESPNPMGQLGGDNTTPLGGSLPRRSQRPGRKNSESTAMCS